MNFSRLMADVTELASQKKLPDKAVIGDLMRVINAVAIPGVNPMNPGKPAELGTLQEGQNPTAPEVPS
jgi:hypothetical protein